MDPVRLIRIKEDIRADNEAVAAALRQRLAEKKTFLLNLMSAPGAGKTSTIMRTVEALRGRIHIGVIEADIESAVEIGHEPLSDEALQPRPAEKRYAGGGGGARDGGHAAIAHGPLSEILAWRVMMSCRRGDANRDAPEPGRESSLVASAVPRAYGALVAGTAVAGALVGFGATVSVGAVRSVGSVAPAASVASDVGVDSSVGSAPVASSVPFMRRLSSILSSRVPRMWAMVRWFFSGGIAISIG